MFPFPKTKSKERVLETFYSVRNFLKAVFICSSSLIIRDTIRPPGLNEILRRNTLYNLIKQESFQNLPLSRRDSNSNS